MSYDNYRGLPWSSWGQDHDFNWGNGAQAGDVLVAARTHLNDDEGIIWPDQKLFPKLREAHRQLQLALIANGVAITSEGSYPIPVPAGTVDLSRPNDTQVNLGMTFWENLSVPIWIKERPWGSSSVHDWVDMQEVDFLPQVEQGPELIYWTWNQQGILFVGATTHREILIRYRRMMKIPQESTDNIGPFFGEIFLSYKTAALAVGSITPRDSDKLAYLEMQARDSLEDLLKLAATQAQSLPTKRRPYHRGGSRMVR